MKAVPAQGRWDSCLPIMKRSVSTLMTGSIHYHVARLEGRGEFQGRGAGELMAKSHVPGCLEKSMVRPMTWNATGNDDGATSAWPTLRGARGRVMKEADLEISCS